MPRLLPLLGPLFGALLWMSAPPCARAQDSYPAPAEPTANPREQPAPPASAPSAELAREQERDRVRALRRDSRRRKRLLLSSSFTHLMLTRFEPDDVRERYAFRATELTVGYRQELADSVGVHLAISAAVGGTKITRITPAFLFFERDSVRAGAGYAIGAEVAPMFGPWGSFYLAPTFHLRWLLHPDASVLLPPSAGDNREERTVRFDMPRMTLGARTQMGVMLGEQHKGDLGFGLDAGRAVGTNARYWGFFLRLGAMFG